MNSGGLVTACALPTRILCFSHLAVKVQFWSPPPGDRRHAVDAISLSGVQSGDKAMPKIWASFLRHWLFPDSAQGQAQSCSILKHQLWPQAVESQAVSGIESQNTPAADLVKTLRSTSENWAFGPLLTHLWNGNNNNNNNTSHLLQSLKGTVPRECSAHNRCSQLTISLSLFFPI